MTDMSTFVSSLPTAFTLHRKLEDLILAIEYAVSNEEGEKDTIRKELEIINDGIRFFINPDEPFKAFYALRLWVESHITRELSDSHTALFIHALKSPHTLPAWFKGVKKTKEEEAGARFAAWFTVAYILDRLHLLEDGEESDNLAAVIMGVSGFYWFKPPLSN